MGKKKKPTTPVDKIDAATGIAQPHDPRATLRDGDPQKSGGNEQ